jgi:hypothetical protein
MGEAREEGKGREVGREVGRAKGLNGMEGQPEGRGWQRLSLGKWRRHQHSGAC